LKIYYTLIDLVGARTILKLGFPETDEENRYSALGHYKSDGKQSEVFLLNASWKPTLLHETLENQMHSASVRYSESLSGNTFIFMFDHDRFNHICDDAHAKYEYIREIIEADFSSDLFGVLIDPIKKPKGWAIIKNTSPDDKIEIQKKVLTRAQ
jgi:hypothetical protein